MDYLQYMAHVQNLANESVLSHHGVKGQEWGKRQYQNEDGSLTPKGREHYGVGTGDDKPKNNLRPIPQYPRTPPKQNQAQQNNKTSAEDDKTLSEEEAKRLEQERKAARNKKIAIAAGVTAAAVVGVLLAKKYHDMKIQNGELQSQAEEGKNKLDELMGENSFLKTQHESSIKTINELTADRKDLKVSNFKLNKELKSTKDENTTLKALNEGLSKSHRQKREQINEMNTKINALKSKNEGLSRTKEHYKQKYNASEAANAGLKKTNELLTSNLRVANIQAEAGNQLANVSQVHQRTYHKILEAISKGEVLFGRRGSK